MESRNGVLFDEIKENRNSKDSTHFSAIVSVVAWGHGVELQWGESWSDTVSLTKAKRINKCHILTINTNNTLIYSLGLGVKLYQTGCIYIIYISGDH